MRKSILWNTKNGSAFLHCRFNAFTYFPSSDYVYT